MKIKWLKRTFLAISLLLILLTVVFYFYVVYPVWGIPFNAQRHGNPPLTPPWALECWLWEDDSNTAARVDELLEGYREHDIPVRTIVLDSPWSTRYNDFQVDTSRYPDPEKWFKKLQNSGYRVVLWMTSMVNSYSKDTRIRDLEVWFSQAKQNGYLVGNGYQWKWWKGTGGFIDYSNPKALKWWQSLQKTVFDYGIDGWKLDGTATLFTSKIFGIPFPYQRTFEGWLTTRNYMDLYYRQEYFHGLKMNPEFVTLSRSIDLPYTHPEGFAPLDAAPVTWVGDQEHVWKGAGTEKASTESDLVHEGSNGIEEATRDILAAVKIGYGVIGSDVAGFSGRTIPPRLYIRWAQFSAFCGLFLNGGHGERALWKRTPNELEIIRKFSWLHTELVPYMYSYVVSSHNGGRPLQKPVAGKYHYLFGDDFLIAPIYRDDLQRQVTLPPGRWRYFFDDLKLIEGGQTIQKQFPLEEFPVFIRDGAIVPLRVRRRYTRLGDENSADFLTILIYPREENHFTLYHVDGSGETVIGCNANKKNVKISLNGVHKAHIFRILLSRKPSRVTLDDRILIENQSWWYQQNDTRLIIQTRTYSEGNYEIVFP